MTRPSSSCKAELDDVGPASQAGVGSTLVLVRNAGHGFSPVGGEISPTRAEMMQIIVTFFDAHWR